MPALGLGLGVAKLRNASGGSGGAIVSASIDANGWLLTLRVTGSMTSPNTNFGNYPLTPDATPKLSLTATSPGFSPSGGVAVSTPKVRPIVGTLAFRKMVYVSLNIATKTINEVDNLDGTITVKIALSKTVYADDTVSALTALTGWRGGIVANQTIAVTNNSTIPAPLVIMRWADVPHQRNTDGSITIEAVVASSHPNALVPVAAVKFTLYDNTTTKTLWATSMTRSARYGTGANALSCYSVTFAANATSGTDLPAPAVLTAGMLRADMEVYPWVGVMRTTDPVGTKPMANLSSDGRRLRMPVAGDAEGLPFTVAYDPGATRYSNGFVWVDPASANNTAALASNVVIYSSAALAKAGGLSTAASSITVAAQAGYLANLSLAAENGLVARTRAIDGLTIVLAAGVHPSAGNTLTTTGTGSYETPCNVIGDPSDADPRNNCIVRSDVASSGVRAQLWAFKKLTLRLSSTNGILSSVINFGWCDEVTLDSTALQNAAAFSGSSQIGTYGQAWFTRTRAWKASIGMANFSATHVSAFIRAGESSRAMTAHTILSTKAIGHLDPGLAKGSYTGTMMARVANSLGGGEDIFWAHNDLRSTDGKIIEPPVINHNIAYPAGSPIDGAARSFSYRRFAFINNVAERWDNALDANMWSSAGENEYCEFRDIVIEGNTTVGNRNSIAWSKMNNVSVTAANYNNTNLNTNFRHANNACDQTGMEDDSYSRSTTNSEYFASTGLNNPTGNFMFARTGCNNFNYGVDAENNVCFTRYGDYFNVQTYTGINSLIRDPYTGFTYDALYDDDFSALGPNAVAGAGAGQGDYRPDTGSLLLGRCTNTNADYDALGSLRVAPFPTGALAV